MPNNHYDQKPTMTILITIIKIQCIIYSILIFGINPLTQGCNATRIRSRITRIILLIILVILLIILVILLIILVAYHPCVNSKRWLPMATSPGRGSP